MPFTNSARVTRSCSITALQLEMRLFVTKFTAKLRDLAVARSIYNRAVTCAIVPEHWKFEKFRREEQQEENKNL